MLLLTFDLAATEIVADLNGYVVLAAELASQQVADDLTLIKTAFGHF
jgi:hypothetical protein